MRYQIKTNKGFLVFMCCFGFLRLAIADYNPIPSGSMRPTLLEGDVVLVYSLKSETTAETWSEQFFSFLGYPKTRTQL